MRFVPLPCLVCATLVAGAAFGQAAAAPALAPAGTATVVLASAPVPATPITLADALRAARDNLDVLQAGHALSAARADVLAADHAPAPVLSAKTASIDLQNGIGPGSVLGRKRIDKSVGLDWTWERGDKRALRTRAAEQAVQAAQSDVEDVRGQQLLATQDAFWQLLAAQQRVAEVREINAGTADMARIADRRVKAGDLAAQDALRTRIEAERAGADADAAELDRQRAALALAQRVRPGAPAGALPVLRAEGDWPALATVAEPAASWEQLALQRPEVRAAQARVAAAQSALDGAQALRRADVTVGASLDHYPGTSNRLVELRVSVPLQWGYRFDGEIGRAQAELAQAQAALEQTLRGSAADLQQLALEMRNAALRAQRYENEILPRARQAGDAAQRAYDKGAIPLSDLLDARRTLRATVLDAIAARADHARAVTAWRLRTAPAE